MNNDIDIKIKITLRDGIKMLANATIYLETSLFGHITIKNFIIWNSQRENGRIHEYANIEPPTYPAFGKYHKLVFFESSTGWEKLEKLIWEEYLKVKAESAPINVKEIDEIKI